MSMSAGSVSINQSTEAVTGSGMALAIYTAEIATYASVLASPGLTVPTLGSTAAPYNVMRPVQQSDIDQVKAQRLMLLNGVRDRANAYGSAIVGYIQANATAGGDPVT